MLSATATPKPLYLLLEPKPVFCLVFSLDMAGTVYAAVQFQYAVP